MAECGHPEDKREFESGNYVPMYGWEIYPGWYCMDCGEMLDIEEEGPDPDMARDIQKESGTC